LNEVENIFAITRPIYSVLRFINEEGPCWKWDGPNQLMWGPILNKLLSEFYRRLVINGLVARVHAVYTLLNKLLCSLGSKRWLHNHLYDKNRATRPIQ
jgi:hypothetical protein